MITNITLENFKCFRKVEINPKLVTLFIGPNGTGKSGVLQALLLLKQSKNVNRALDLSGPLTNLSFDDFMLRGTEQPATSVDVQLRGFKAYSVGLRKLPLGFTVDRSYLPDGSVLDEMLGEDQDEDESDHEGSSRLVLMEFLRSLRIVPTTRGLSRRTYHLGPDSHEQITLTAGLSEQEDEVATTLGYSAPNVSRVSHWIKQVTGVEFKTDIVPPQSVKPVSITAMGEVSLTAEGFGTNALVQLLFELARAVESATVLMEEPEIHLHPKAQAELASVIVEEAKASNKQVIMTTHSEHIAGRLLTLVAERKLTPDEVAIYSFEKDEETGVCSASEIEVTPRGQVVGGLRSFFETDLDEMRRYADALRSQE